MSGKRKESRKWFRSKREAQKAFALMTAIGLIVMMFGFASAPAQADDHDSGDACSELDGIQPEGTDCEPPPIKRETRQLPPVINCETGERTVDHQERIQEPSWNGDSWVFSDWSDWTTYDVSLTMASDEQLAEHCSVEEPPADSDGDGVNNENDAFPNDPNESKDSDGDGTGDNADQCPNQTGPANNGGCPVEEPPADSDGDGVNDNKDDCPDTPDGTVVDNKGCLIDVEDPSDAVKNNPDYWENVYPGSTCVKYDNVNAKTFTVPAPPEGTEYVAAIVKAGSRNSLGGNDPNEVDETVKVGDVLTHSSGKDISHVILCYKKTPPKDEEVTPAAPTHVDECGTENDTYTIPETEGVVYKVDGVKVESGTYPGTGTVKVTAHAKDGYVLKGDTKWKLVFTDEPCEEEPEEVTPAAPTATEPSCEQPNVTVTPSNQEGVIWSPTGETVLRPGESVTYTASPDEGYVFPDDAETEFSFTNDFDVEKCEEEPPELVVTVIPNQGSCEARTPKAQVTTSFASSIGYRLEGEETEFVHREVQAGTYTVTLPDVAEGDSVSYEIIVVPLDDSAEPIVKGPFTFSVPEDCDEVPPCTEFQDENPDEPCYVERKPDVRERSSERESCKLGGVVTTHAVFTTTYSFNEVTQQWESSETATSSQSFEPYTAAELKEKGCVKQPPPPDNPDTPDNPTFDTGLSGQLPEQGAGSMPIGLVGLLLAGLVAGMMLIGSPVLARVRRR